MTPATASPRSPIDGHPQLKGRFTAKIHEADPAMFRRMMDMNAATASSILFLVSPQNAVTSGAVLPLYAKA